MLLLIGREQRVTRLKEMRVENMLKEECSLSERECLSYNRG